MEDKMNLSKEEVLNLLKDFPEKPLFNKIIITLNTEEEDNEFVLSDNVMSETQYVVAVGDTVKNIKEGDLVRIDIEKMMVKEINPNNSHEMITSIKLSPIQYKQYTFAIIDDRLVKTVFINQTLETNE